MSFARISACSSGVGSGGVGPGYPVGNSVRFAVLVVFRMNAGDIKLASRCGSSLSRNGMAKAEAIEQAVMRVVAAKRS